MKKVKLRCWCMFLKSIATKNRYLSSQKGFKRAPIAALDLLIRFVLAKILIYSTSSDQRGNTMRGLVENASFADFEPEGIKRYRQERSKVKADASELVYGDEDLLKAVRAIETEKGLTNFYI
jgi:hypothetical protein